jgi:nucleoside-diphosphate-sugar epimerase
MGRLQALIVGGTGPTGPHIAEGLVGRGYQVSVLHRGLHETAALPAVAHIHADPFDATSLADAIGQKTFELVVAAYGRTRLVVEALAGRCERFIGIGGTPVYRGVVSASPARPHRLPLGADEAAPRAGEEAPDWVRAMVRLEDRVFQLHAEGVFQVTWFRYPWVYGPRNPLPLEWSIIKRVVDGRDFVVLPEAGLTVITRGAGRNLAHAVLLAVDDPEAASGQVFNCGDDRQLSFREWVETIAEAAGGSLAVVSLPWALAAPAWPFMPPDPFHALVDTTKLRRTLGYTDLVSPDRALEESVRWYRQHPPEGPLNDPFDYDFEDTLVERLRLAGQAVVDELGPDRFARPLAGHHG